ncbi:MAG TPA: hypothetical protein VFW18_04525 [Gaiellales bacterium]|nr:hypothetical protein [Gaiellales bacterium]
MNEAERHPRVEHVTAALIRPEVVYIGGADRSGSTILGLVMGTLPGTAYVGEVMHVWRRGVAENQLCGCGEPFLACPFWREVGQAAFGGWQHVDVDHVEWLSRRVLRERFGLAMPLLKRRLSYRANFAAYLEYIEPLYRAIWRVSGARRIVDSSKGLSQYGALAALSSIDLSLVHLVRDSRGVAHSWTRKIVMPEITSDREYMATFSPAWAALQWDFMNVEFDIARNLMYRARPSVLVRYESFAADPVRASHAALASVSKTTSPDGVSDSSPLGRIRVGTQHTVSGNPARFSGPAVTVRPDVRWHAEMRRTRKALVTAVTWPILARYAILDRGRPRRRYPPASPV